MSTGYDPFTAGQDAVYAALAAAVPVELATVVQHVPENAQPPLMIIGDITVEAAGAKGGGLDLVTVEVACQVRSNRRRALFPLLKAARDALEDQSIAAPDALLGLPVFLNAVTGQSVDGTLYEGILRVQFFAQSA